MQAKKVKASKKKKLHLFRDGFTLPSATKPVGDANSAQLIAGFGNEVQASNATIKIPVIFQFRCIKLLYYECNFFQSSSLCLSCLGGFVLTDIKVQLCWFEWVNVYLPHASESPI